MDRTDPRLHASILDNDDSAVEDISEPHVEDFVEILGVRGVERSSGNDPGDEGLLDG